METSDHKLEFILVGVLLLLLLFVCLMQWVHNDQLASKGMDFIYGDLGALWQATQRNKSSQQA